MEKERSYCLFAMLTNEHKKKPQHTKEIVSFIAIPLNEVEEYFFSWMSPSLAMHKVYYYTYYAIVVRGKSENLIAFEIMPSKEERLWMEDSHV